MLTTQNITDETIEAFANNAAQAGDLLQHAICQLALGLKEYADPAWLNDNTCLDEDDRRKLSRMTKEEALEDVVASLRDNDGG